MGGRKPDEARGGPGGQEGRETERDAPEPHGECDRLERGAHVGMYSHVASKRPVTARDNAMTASTRASADPALPLQRSLESAPLVLEAVRMYCSILPERLATSRIEAHVTHMELDWAVNRPSGWSSRRVSGDRGAGCSGSSPRTSGRASTLRRDRLAGRAPRSVAPLPRGRGRREETLAHADRGAPARRRGGTLQARPWPRRGARSPASGCSVPSTAAQPARAGARWP